jgi:CO/xanthine dehydrogenase Mo-binding subunit
VADVRKDGTATIWAGTQNPHGDRDSAAEMLGLDPENVRLIWRQASGGYGRYTFDDSVADAALLSSMAGRPVRVQWMRHEENSWEPISPAMVFDIRGGLDDNGNIVGIEHEQWSARHMLVTKGHLLAWRHSGENPAEGYAWGGGIPNVQYDIPNIRMVRHVTEDIVRPMSLRTPGSVQSHFAFESMIDEMAVKIAEDPIEFRLRHLSNDRGIAVIKSVSQRAKWGVRPAGPRSDEHERFAEGRGIAYVEHYGAHLATLVRLVVDKQTGHIKVRNVWVAVDHGEIVNPDGLLNQTEGGTIQGISRSLFEDVVYKDSRRTNIDWASYPVIRYDDIPEIDIQLINRPEVTAVGAGEPSSAPVPAAIGNAIYDAIGVRLRTAPFLPERVKTALAS